MTLWWQLLLAFTFFSFGFSLGVWVGRRQGFGLGLRAAPLRLRQVSLIRGRCVLCEGEKVYLEGPWE